MLVDIMNSYERVMNILMGRVGDIDRIPCVNTVSVATIDFMKATNAYWPESHRDPEKMAKLASAAHRICGLDNVSLPFDMLLEAEALGVKVEYPEGRIQHPYVKEFSMELFKMQIPKDVVDAGRVPVVLRAIRILRREFEGKTPINVYLNPPFTCVSNYVVGIVRFFTLMRRSPDKAHEILKSSLSFFIEVAEAYEEAGANIITFHEMGATTVPPIYFDEFITPYLREIVKHLKTPTVLNVCGLAKPIIGKMVNVGCSAIAVDELTPIKHAREVVNSVKINYPVIGNISPGKVLLPGPVSRIMEEVGKCIGDGVSMVSPGCDFHLETPIEHIKALVDATVKYGSQR
jgi:[methyl-Co(III) methanol-specific corrinoid protein]:coenzyme M methyltransferase